MLVFFYVRLFFQNILFARHPTTTTFHHLNPLIKLRSEESETIAIWHLAAELSLPQTTFKYLHVVWLSSLYCRSGSVASTFLTIQSLLMGLDIDPNLTTTKHMDDDDDHSHNGHSEIQSFIKVWLLAFASICYCYYFVSRISKHIPRLFSLLPVFSLFIFLPFSLSSVHLGGPTVFYLVWLANFKLLLFSFNLGPLSSPLSLLHFISIALFPIKPNTKTLISSPISKTSSKSKPLLLSIKVVLLAIIIRSYSHRQYFHPSLIYVLYCCHVYLGVELVLAMSAAPFRATLGLELEPQFNEPYLATSLQDFWGRRWNLMVTSILRPTVYDPVRRRWGQSTGVFATFLVSGLVHEVIYYYITRVDPTWEVTWFFVLHGVCTAAEVAVKKAVGDRWRLHRVVSGPLTLVFVIVTAVWLFFPQIVRNGVDQKAIREYGMLVAFVREKLVFRFNWATTL